MATELAQRAEELETFFKDREARLARVASDTLSPERAVQLLIEVGGQNPRVLHARRLTLWRCIQISLELGLPIGGGAGQMFVLPFKNTKLSNQLGSEQIDAVPVIGYRGLVTLLGRSGITIKTRLAYSGEEFDWREGGEQILTHRPNPSVREEIATALGDSATPAAIEAEMNELVLYAYSVATTPSGLSTFEVMDRMEIKTAESMSPGRNSSDSPWRDPLSWSRMVRKTILSRHAKELPLGDNKAAVRAVEIESHFAAGKTVNDLGALGFEDPDEE
jgi:phage RecT family recombinase